MSEERVGGVRVQPQLVKSFVRQYRNEILASWKRDARTLPAAAQLSPVLLVDQIPELLDQIADAAEGLLSGRALDLESGTARHHALERLGEGFDIAAVVQELSMLRGCLLSVWERASSPGGIVELRALDLAIDRAIAATVAHYAEERERTFAGLDRISTASVEAHDLDELLNRLLTVFVETAPAADVAQILLRDGESLVVRATAGLETDRARAFSVAIGHGFEGTVAARRKPIELRTAFVDPLVTNEALRAGRIRALYGVPLIQADEVIGVAYMGSATASTFSHEDRQLFRSLALRATAGIHQHLLRAGLAKSEERFKEIAEERAIALATLESLLAAAPVGIGFLDRDLRYLRVNDALAEMNGRPAAEHIGHCITEVLPDVAHVLEPLLRGVIETGRRVHNVMMPRLPTPGGAVLSLFVNYFPVRSSSNQVIGVGAILIDVSETRKAQDALRLQQQRMQAFLEQAPAAIWVTDASGRVILANHRLADLLGRPYENVVGRRAEELLPPDVAAQHRMHDLIVLRENRAIEVEETAPGPRGTRTFLTVKFPIPEDPPAVGGIGTEITERKRMEEELRIAMRAREDVLAVVSHDLRSPLSVIDLSANMLAAHVANDPRGRERVELIRRTCLHMETLIEDLLSSANIRADRLDLELEPEATRSLIDEACEMLRPMGTKKGVTLVCKCDAADTRVACDRERILQVFANLIGNAIKFCRSGDTITINAERDDDRVRFSVADTGPGIAPEVLPRLFDAYFSGPERTKGSAGLGLYISKGIVEGHGGKIWVESTPGTGATFYFTIPIAG